MEEKETVLVFNLVFSRDKPKGDVGKCMRDTSSCPRDVHLKGTASGMGNKHQAKPLMENLHLPTTRRTTSPFSKERHSNPKNCKS